MYKSAEELLAVQTPDQIDALAQRSLKITAKARLANRDALIAGDQESADACMEVHMLAALPLMFAHKAKDYEFMRKVVAEQPTDNFDNVDLFALLPVVIHMPDLEESTMMLDLCEADFDKLRATIPVRKLN